MRVSGKILAVSLLALSLAGALPAAAESLPVEEGAPVPAASAEDLAALHAWLVEADGQEGFESVSWIDMDLDGMAEALVVLPGTDGWKDWRLYRAGPEGPALAAWHNARSIEVVEGKDGAPNLIVSDGIAWEATPAGPRPAGGLIEKNARRATSPSKEELAFLAHMGHQKLDRALTDVYRLSFIPGKGKDRVIVLRDPRFAQADGSWPYMILDDWNRILISGRSADQPYIFADKDRPAQIIEIRDGAATVREIRVVKMQ